MGSGMAWFGECRWPMLVRVGGARSVTAEPRAQLCGTALGRVGRVAREQFRVVLCVLALGEARVGQWGGPRAVFWLLRMMAAATTWATSGWVRTAMRRNRPPQSRAKSSMAKTRRIRSARRSLLGRSGATGLDGVGSDSVGRKALRSGAAGA